MASLIWDPSYISSSQSTFKFRVKMSDGSNMADSDEGIDFINIVNAQDFSKIELGADGSFAFSLGLGYQNGTYDSNYNSMWAVAEHFYGDSSQQGVGSGSSRLNSFASLGNQMGLINSHGLTHLPFSRVYAPNEEGVGGLTVSQMYWEEGQVNYSCIIQLVFPFMTYWYPNIVVDRNGFHEDVNIPMGDAAWTQGDWETVSVNYLDIDDYTILIGFILQITGEGGTRDIFPVDRSAVDIAISQGRINYDSGTIPFAPIKYQSTLIDFTVNVLNLNSPQFVNEAERDPLQLQIKSEGYSGEIKIYLVDNESIEQVNEELASDLDNWYGDITEDVIAQYGVLDYDGQKIITDTIVAGQVKDYEITYTAYNVNIGQTDNMSIFIRAADPNWSYYTSEQRDEWIFYENLTSSKITYVDNIEIDIIDVSEEYIEIYNPSDNLITQPADIVHHIFGEELGFDKNNIDTPSKIESWGQHEGFQMAFSVNEGIESKKLIQEISQSCKSLPIIADSNLKFITVKNTYRGGTQYYEDGTIEQVSTIKADDVLTYLFSRTPLDDIVTKVELKYNKDYGLDTYLDSYIAEANKNAYFNNGDMSINNRQDNYYNIKIRPVTGNLNHINSYLDFESAYITDLYSAKELGDYLFYWNVNQHNIVELKLPLNYYDLEIGDLIEFDKMILGKTVYGEKYVLDEDDDMPVRAGQYILPLFMITETKKGLDSIKIKAIQLHHMESDYLNYKGTYYQHTDLLGTGQQSSIGSCDFNGDGLADILDLVYMVNVIISGESFTDEEIVIGDTNFDGSVNILDAVNLVSRITNE